MDFASPVSYGLPLQELEATSMANKKQINELLGQTLQAYHPFYQEDVLKWQREIDVPGNWFALT